MERYKASEFLSRASLQDGVHWLDADGTSVEVAVPAGEARRTYGMRGAADGTITVTGTGPGDAFRCGPGPGHAVRGGDGNAYREGSGEGNACRTGDGPGDAHRSGGGDGHAFRTDDGEGHATRDGDGVGHAVRTGAGKDAATTTISDIAADVRRLCPEHFPRSTDTEFRIYADITSLAMIGAMVLATHTLRSAGGWMTTALRDGRTTSAFFFDHDHGGDELRSLHAAFLWAKETPDAK